MGAVRLSERVWSLCQLSQRLPQRQPPSDTPSKQSNDKTKQLPSDQVSEGGDRNSQLHEGRLSVTRRHRYCRATVSVRLPGPTQSTFGNSCREGSDIRGERMEEIYVFSSHS